MMALRKLLILRSPRSGRLEGRTAPVQPIVDYFTCSKAGTHLSTAGASAPWFPACAGMTTLNRSMF